MKKKIFGILLVMVGCFILTGCGVTPANKEIPNEFGSVPELTVFDTIHKFNVEISDNGGKYFANNDNMIAQDGLYWYGIYEDITSYVKPVEFGDDIKKDITETITIRYDVNSKNEEMALNYVKYLIKANNASLTDDEISSLMEQAKEKQEDGKIAHNGKGITVGILKTSDTIEYQIVRIYE